MASGGLRATEACAIRLCDIDFSVNPTKIHVRKEYAKTKVARDIYVSDEATKFLKEWIDWKYRKRHSRSKTPIKNLTHLLFTIRTNMPVGVRTLYNKLTQEFNKILHVVELDQRKEGMQRRKITLHSFRRFAKTVISDQVGQDYSEWFLGHNKSPYYIKKEQGRRDIYATKCMKYLTYLDYTTLEATGKNIEAKISEKEKEIQLLRQRDQMKDQELRSMREQIQTIEQSQRQSFEEFKVENHRIIEEAMAKYKETLSPKALERFSRKSILEVLDE